MFYWNCYLPHLTHVFHSIWSEYSQHMAFEFMHFTGTLTENCQFQVFLIQCVFRFLVLHKKIKSIGKNQHRNSSNNSFNDFACVILVMESFFSTYHVCNVYSLRQNLDRSHYLYELWIWPNNKLIFFYVQSFSPCLFNCHQTVKLVGCLHSSLLIMGGFLSNILVLVMAI